MRIKLLELLSGARQATGLAVVIDVFRAAATACRALSQGAARVLPVADTAEALALKAAHPDYVLVGERNCLKPEGFDFGNSPTELAGHDLSGLTVVQATSAGTRGLAAAMDGAEEAFFLGFVNMSATVRAIRARAPEVLSIVAMGRAGLETAPEDKLCGVYLANELQDVPNVFETLPRFLRHTASAGIFFGDTAIVPEEDFAACLTLDAVDFAVACRRLPKGGLVLARQASPLADDAPAGRAG